MALTPLFGTLAQDATLQALLTALHYEDGAVGDGDPGFPLLLRRGPITAPLALTDTVGDYALPIVTAEGKQVVALNSDPNLYWQYGSAALAATTAAISLKTTAGSTVKNYITDLEIQLTAAVSGGTVVQIKQGSTVIATHNFAGTAGETWTRSFRTPHFSANNAAITATFSVAATVNMDATGFASV